MTRLFDLSGKVATVVGGTGGLGEAIAHGLAEHGAKVVVAARNLTRLEEVVEDIKSKFGVETAAFGFDITDEKSVARLVQQVTSRFGTVDILVNAQGVNLKSPAIEFSVADWNLLFDVNVRGTMLTCREFAKVMIAKKSGKIINLSSVRGIRATKWSGNVGYSTTKGAVDMLTKALAAEWAPYNINVNAIAPSLVQTRGTEVLFKDPARIQKHLNSTPLGRLGTVDDVVGACVFLASRASDFITGQILYVDGGLTAIG